MEWASSVNVNKEICKTSTREYIVSFPQNKNTHITIIYFNIIE